MRCEAGDGIESAVQVIAVHVGTTSNDQPTELTPATVHVRVVAALIANPAKQ